MAELIDLLLHVDRYLIEVIANYGAWIYALLFLIVFAETGLVVTPFLPGDSLLFATGALAATGALDLRLAVDPAAGGGHRRRRRELLRSAARWGCGSWSKARTDPRWGRWVNPAYVERAHSFFERHGGKAIVLGRFMPIVRTFVPFVAGIAEMSYPVFALYNVAGAVAWVGICVGRRVSLRQRADRQGQFLARGDRHRDRVGAADGLRVRALPARVGALADPAQVSRRAGRFEDEQLGCFVRMVREQPGLQRAELLR